MYYILVLLLAAIVFYGTAHIVSSVIKGCLITILFVFLLIGAIMFLSSANKTVRILNLYEIDNFKVMKATDK